MNDQYKTNIKDPADTSEEAIYRAHVQYAAILGYGIEKRAQYNTFGGPPHWTKHDPSNGFDFVRFKYRVVDDEGHMVGHDFLHACAEFDRDAGPKAQEHDPYIGNVAPKVASEVEALARAVANKYDVELAGLQVTIKPKVRKPEAREPREFWITWYGDKPYVQGTPPSIKGHWIHVREVIDDE